jgi:hypothetical protein
VDGEVVVERRRQWTPEQKAALLAEVEAQARPGFGGCPPARGFDEPAVQVAITMEGRDDGGARHGGAAGGICSVRCRRRCDRREPDSANCGRCSKPAGCRAGLGLTYEGNQDGG